MSDVALANEPESRTPTGEIKDRDPVDPIDDIYTEPGDDDGDETTRDDAS